MNPIMVRLGIAKRIANTKVVNHRVNFISPNGNKVNYPFIVNHFRQMRDPEARLKMVSFYNIALPNTEMNQFILFTSWIGNVIKYIDIWINRVIRSVSRLLIPITLSVHDMYQKSVANMIHTAISKEYNAKYQFELAANSRRMLPMEKLSKQQTGTELVHASETSDSTNVQTLSSTNGNSVLPDATRRFLSSLEKQQQLYTHQLDEAEAEQLQLIGQKVKQIRKQSGYTRLAFCKLLGDEYDMALLVAVENGIGNLTIATSVLKRAQFITNKKPAS